VRGVSRLSVVSRFAGAAALAAAALVAGTSAANAGAGAAIIGPLSYGGGSVQPAPRVYVDYWGWTSDPSGEQAYLQRFLSSIGQTPWLATIDQYGVRSTPVSLLAGTWSDPMPVPASPSAAQIKYEAQAAADHFGVGNLSVPQNAQIIVATPTGHSSTDLLSPCGFHGVYGTASLSFTYLPYVTDFGAGCGQNAVNPGSAGLLDGVSIVAGRELADAATDPQGNAWKDGLGNEDGDRCQSFGDVTTYLGTFATQSLWSNDANGCVSASAPRHWSNWSAVGAPSAGIVPISSPAVSSWGPNRLDTFVQGGDHAIWHDWYDTAGWHTWQSLGGTLFSSPAAVSRAYNTIDLFGIGDDYSVWRDSWNGVAWSTWQRIGAPPPGLQPVTPAVSSWGANRLDLFALGTDQAVWHTSWNGAGWSSWESLGEAPGTSATGPIGFNSPAAVSWQNGRIDLFDSDTSGTYWHRTFAGGAWNSWRPEPGGLQLAAGLSGSPAVSSWGANQLDVFVENDKTSEIDEAWWDSVAWSPWQGIAATPSASPPPKAFPPAAVSWAPGRTDLFRIDENGMLEHMYLG
jgi:hypothetical protein